MADEAGDGDDRSVAGPVEYLVGEPVDAARGAAERLVFFSDAVVAIAMTLLAIDLPVPSGGSTPELLASVRQNSLHYATFVISFLVVGAHWQAHHRVFRYLGRVDRTFVNLSFAWLLVIIVTPFLTEVLREGELDVTRFGLYAFAQALLLMVFAAMQGVARRRGLFSSGTPPEILGGSWPHQLLGAAGFLVSIPLFLLIGGWAFVLWGLVPNVPQLVAGVRGRRRRSADA